MSINRIIIHVQTHVFFCVPLHEQIREVSNEGLLITIPASMHTSKYGFHQNDPPIIIAIAIWLFGLLAQISVCHRD